MSQQQTEGITKRSSSQGLRGVTKGNTEKNAGQRQDDLPDVKPSLSASKSDKGEKGKRGNARKKRKTQPNNVRKLRVERMMSKAELARRAGVSPLTVDRVEKGMNCRMDTKRKILEALGLKPSDRKVVFPEDD